MRPGNAAGPLCAAGRDAGGCGTAAREAAVNGPEPAAVGVRGVRKGEWRCGLVSA